MDKLKIVEINPNIQEDVEKAGGYCPCSILKTPDTKCMCKEFREQPSRASAIVVGLRKWR